MATRVTRKQLLKEDEFVETAGDFGDWLEENWRKMAMAGAGLVAVLILAGALSWYMGQRREATQLLLNQGVSAYQRAEEGGFADAALLDEALGMFDEVIARSSGSSAGRLATFYKGAALIRRGEVEPGVALLERLSEDNALPETLEGATKSLLAKGYAKAGKSDKAIELLQGIVDTESPSFPADQALLMMGRIQADSERPDAARVSWQRLVDEFPQSPAAGEARQLLSP